ncbi:MAG: YibE/F family protein [Geodermatophilaceae bacterium]|nr:YibE/F family protein [Geodermatophilaceae bacterium]
MSHSHLPGSVDDVPVALEPWIVAQRRRAVFLLALVLVPIGLATLVGLAVLWPDGEQSAARQAAVEQVLPGSTFVDATVLSVKAIDCSGPGLGSGSPVPATLTCGTVLAQVEEGADAGTAVLIDIPAEVFLAGFDPDDRLRLLRSPAFEDIPVRYSFADFARERPLTVLALAFAVVVVAVARLRGAAALIGLAFAFVILVTFMLPGLLNGEPPVLIGLVGSAAIMFVVLYLAHGFSARTTTALAGTLFGLALIAVLGSWAGSTARLTGLSSEENLTLTYLAGQIDPAGIVLCGIIIAGLGVLNDVTITQASAVWQLHELAPGLPARTLFASAMRIGRDHIASTVYTIVFAYAGAALPALLLLEIYQRPFGDTVTGEAIAEEIVRTMVGGIGLVLAVPVTTAVGVLLVKSVSRQDRKTTASTSGLRARSGT